MPVQRYQCLNDVWVPMDGGAATPPPTPPPGPGSYPLFGASNPAGFTAANARYQGITCFRDYASGGAGIGTWTTGGVADIVNNSTNVVPVWSFKGWNEPEVVAWINSKPRDGRLVWLGYYHEPENDNLTTAGKADWRAKQVRLRELLVENNRNGQDIKLCSILMQYTLSAGSGRNPDDYYVDRTPAGDKVFDACAWDFYDPAYKNGVWNTAPSLDSMLSRSAVTGLPWAIGETGAGVGPKRMFDAVKLQTWLKGLADGCIANKAAFVTWWDRSSIASNASGTADYNTWGPIPAQDFRINPNPVLTIKAPGSPVGGAAYNETPNPAAQNLWTNYCATSRAKNGIAYP